MQITFRGNIARASEIMQRANNLSQGTTLDEILDELTPAAQDEIHSLLLTKAESFLLEEEQEEREDREWRRSQAEAQ